MRVEAARHAPVRLDNVPAAIPGIPLLPPPPFKSLDPFCDAERINVLDCRRDAGNAPRPKPAQPPLPTGLDVIRVAISRRQDRKARAQQRQEEETPPCVSERVPAAIGEVK